MRWVACAVALLTLGLTHGEARAQAYPSKPVRVIVPFAAGGAVDALARIVAAKLQEGLGQPVVVENRAGAGGNTGADAVAKSPADGYTILQNTNGQAISPAIYRTLPFDTLKDFIPVTQLVATSTVLVANTKLPAKSVKELIALAKASPGKLNYGMTGVGNSLHLTMEMLKRAAGIDIQAIPYRGDAPLNTALMAGENVTERVVNRVFSQALDVIVHVDRNDASRGAGRHERDPHGSSAAVQGRTDHRRDLPIHCTEHAAHPHQVSKG